MGLLYSAGTAFSEPTTIRAWVEYPFRDQGDSATKIYHHVMRVFSSSYAPLNDDDVLTAADEKPLRSPFSDDANAYYVGDYGLTHIGNGLVEFDRQFANIPAERTEPNGFYPFAFPFSNLPVQTKKTTTSKSYTYVDTVITVYFTLSSTDAALFELNDFIDVYNANKFSYRKNSSFPETEVFTLVNFKITNKTGTSFVAVKESFGTSYVGYFGSYGMFSEQGATAYEIRKTIIPGSTQVRQINSSSIINYRYIKTSVPNSIKLERKFEMLTATGLTTDEFVANSQPTVDEYTTWYESGDYAINAEDESIRRWLGNIYEIALVKVLPR